MNIKNKGLAEIHVAVFLFGLSGLFGKLLSLSPMIIVLGRVFFSSIFLLGIILYLKKGIKLKQKEHYLYMVIMGAILAIHWSAFFQSIQISTVAIGLLTFSTFPVFVTFLEPLFLKEKIKISEIATAIITVSGVMLVIPKFQFGFGSTQGVLWGILSGFTYAVLSIMNRKFVKQYSSTIVAFYEQFVATIVLIPFLLFQKPVFQTKVIFLLILLGIIFTGIAHTLFINGLKNVKTQIASIISCLEPVYGIVFATVLLSEVPTARETLGGIIIMGTTIYSTIKAK